MGSRTLNRSRGCCLRVQDVRVAVILLAAVFLLSCYGPGTVDGAATGTFKKLFVFGDSYVDTGNRDPDNGTYTAIGPVNQSWRPPYGRTWPGRPAGRFSDGDLLSDFLGKYMGLNPAVYRTYKSKTSTRTNNGMNFAVGGSGVFDNLGFTKIRDQIAQFKKLLDAKVYDHGSVFRESVVLFSISGNDYAAYSRNSPTLNVTFITTAVVNQMVHDLKSLYNLGFRNFVISELQPLECLPSATVALGYAACVTPLAVIPTTHNLHLTAAIDHNFPSSAGASVIFLDNQAAFYNIINKLVASGSRLPLKPCCVAQPGALCGDRDSNNKPRYTVCSSSSASPFFWDANHPMEAGWRKVFNLYTSKLIHTQGKSLPDFLGVK